MFSGAVHGYEVLMLWDASFMFREPCDLSNSTRTPLVSRKFYSTSSAIRLLIKVIGSAMILTTIRCWEVEMGRVSLPLGMVQ